MYNSLYDSVLIEIDSIYDNKRTIRNDKGEKIDLELPTVSYEHVTEASKRRTSGRVVSVCSKISKSIENLAYTTLSGFPSPLKTYTYTQEADEKGYPQGKQYSCGGHEDKLAFNKNIQVREGDYVHFNYLSLNEDSFVSTSGDKEVHAIPYKNIFAFIRAEELHVIDGWVLAQAEYYDDVKEVEHEGVLTKMQVSSTGIIIDHNPTKKKQEAKVVKVGKDIAWEVRDVEIGDNILFGINKNKVHLIDNKEYYVIKKDRLIGCVRNNEYVPYGNYIIVTPIKRKEGNIVLSEAYKGQIVRGKVLKHGLTSNLTNEYKKDSIIHFAPKSNAMLHIKDENILFIKEDYVYATGECDVEIVK